MVLSKKKRRFIIIVSILVLCVIGIPVIYTAFFSETASYEELLEKSNQNLLSHVEVSGDQTVPLRNRLTIIKISAHDIPNTESYQIDRSKYDEIQKVFDGVKFKKIPRIRYSFSVRKNSKIWRSITFFYEYTAVYTREFKNKIYKSTHKEELATIINIMYDNTVYFKYAMHHDNDQIIYMAKITDEQRQQLMDLMNQTVS